MDTKQEPLDTGFGERTTAGEIAAGIDLDGRTVVVTGGHSGIGLETTRVLSTAGASVTVGARDTDKAHAALVGIRRVTVERLDLSDPESIDEFGERYLAAHATLDILVNNAGIMATPLMRDSRGYELQFATNHLGHFQLTARLWSALARAKVARVVTLSSFGHRFSGVDLDDPNFTTRPYDKWKAYGQSKTANSLFSVELDRRGKDAGVRAFAVHPGRILATELSRYMDPEEQARMMAQAGLSGERAPGIKSIEQGAATTAWCAASPQLADMGGVYCADCDISPLVCDDSTLSSGVRSWAVDKPTAKSLWGLSERLIGYSWPI